jgi:hypothetical protein
VFDFAPVTMLGPLGLRIFEATGLDISDLRATSNGAGGASARDPEEWFTEVRIAAQMGSDRPNRGQTVPDRRRARLDGVRCSGPNFPLDHEEPANFFVDIQRVRGEGPACKVRATWGACNTSEIIHGLPERF